jgi:hypothetical protein
MPSGFGGHSSKLKGDSKHSKDLFGSDWATVFNIASLDPNQNWGSMQKHLGKWCDKSKCAKDKGKKWGKKSDIIG